VQREQVVEVRVASSYSTREGCYGAEGAGHSSIEGASGSNPEGAVGNFSTGHPDLDRGGFPDVEGAVASQGVDHGGCSSNGSTSLAKRVLEFVAQAGSSTLGVSSSVEETQLMSR
jgi:hypothetical protein